MDLNYKNTFAFGTLKRQMCSSMLLFTASRARNKAVQVKHPQCKQLKSETNSIAGIIIFILIGDDQ